MFNRFGRLGRFTCWSLTGLRAVHRPTVNYCHSRVSAKICIERKRDVKRSRSSPRFADFATVRSLSSRMALLFEANWIVCLRETHLKCRFIDFVSRARGRNEMNSHLEIWLYVSIISTPWKTRVITRVELKRCRFFLRCADSSDKWQIACSLYREGVPRKRLKGSGLEQKKKENRFALASRE